MSDATTIRRVPRPRGELSDRRERRLALAASARDKAEAAYRAEVVAALHEGSFSEVSKVTGLSTNTLQRWKREAGK